MEDTKTIVFRTPIKFGSMEYPQIELREPTAGELEKATQTQSSIGTAITLISLVAKIPRKVAELIPSRELAEAADFLGSVGSSSKPDEPATD